MLTKIKVNNCIPDTTLHPLLYLVLKNDFIPNSVYFTNGELVINDKSKYSYKLINNKIVKLNKIKHIPIHFYKDIYIWKKINTFNQNNKYNASTIRKYVISLLKDSHSKNIIGIGGESYCYFYCLDYKHFTFFSNNIDIIDDYNFNSKKYLLCENIDVFHRKIDYNKKINYYCEGDIIINLSTITLNIIDFLNNNNFNNIIIINCKEKNRKRLDLLKYKMVDFSHFNNVTVYKFNL